MKKITHQATATADRTKFGTLAALAGMLINLVLAALKLVAGIISSSAAITADALNNLTDSGTSLLTLAGFKLSAKPADKSHPFGHARMEYITAMIISLVIALVGLEALADGFRRIFYEDELTALEIGLPIIIVLSASVLAKFVLGLYYVRAYKKTESKALRASAADSFTDMLATLAALISAIIVEKTGFTLLDPIVGIAVSVLIIYAGIKILLDTKNSILGEAPIEGTVDAIKEIVAKYPEVLGIHDLLVHNYGPTNFIASFHAEVNGDGDIFELHDTIDSLEREIKNSLGISATIHMDPIAYNDELTNSYKALVAEIIAELGEYTLHDLRITKSTSNPKLIFDIAVPFEEIKSDTEITREIRERILEKNSTLYCVITIDRV